MRRLCPGRAETSARPVLVRRPVVGRSSVLCVLLLSGPVVLATAGPALAHTSLVRSDPGTSAVVAGPFDTVTLVFDQPVSSRAAQVVVTGPDGADVAAGPARVAGATVSAPVTGFPSAGGYRLAYRVLAEDGHPLTGQVPFEVAPAAVTDIPTAAGATSTPAPVSGAAQAQTPAAATRSSGTGVAPAALAGLAALAGALVAGAVRAGRRGRTGR